MEIRLRELDHPGLLKNYRVCPNCHGKFTPDAKTKQRQAILIVASIIPLGLTLLLYFHGTEWLLPAVFSYVAFGWSIHRGNRHVFLVPHQPDRDAANDT